MNLLSIFVPVAEAAALTDKGSETVSQSSEGVGEFLNVLWSSLDNWIAAIIVVLASIYLSKMIKKVVVDRVADKMGDEHEEVLILVGRATYAAVLAVGLTIGLKVGGIDLTVIIAAVGFGIGFALQDIIMNFIAGVIILASRQFAIGDFIEVNSTLGQVKEIQSRATILQALDGTKIIVPNSDLFTNPVTSYTSNPFRRIEVPVGVEYRTDLKKATNVMLMVLHQHQRVMKEPAPAVILDEFSDSAITFKVRFWVESKDRWIQIKSEVIQQLKDALDEAGINIPFPIRTLVFDKDTENVVIPTHAMTEEEMKQHKIEQIQAQEEQAAKDATNPGVQQTLPNGTGQTEYSNLEKVEEQHAAEQEAQVAEQITPANQSAVSKEQSAEEVAPEIPVAEKPVATEPAPEPEVAPAEPIREEITQEPIPEPEPVDATATVTPVEPKQPELAPEPIPVMDEPVQPAAEAPKDTGADFLDSQESPV